VFAISGTYIVDLKDNSTHGRMCTKLQPDFLSNFFSSVIKMQSSKPVEGSMNRTEFQKYLHLDLFNHSVCFVSI
jgi:hypothetical protein